MLENYRQSETNVLFNKTMASSITLRFTPAHTSIRWHLKSITSCTFSDRYRCPKFYN